MATEKTIILTHGDLDGLVSAILLLRRLPSTSPIRITNGENLGRELLKLAKTPEGPTAIYLTDLPLVTNTAAHVLTAIRTLTDAGRTIHIYDHHRGWETEGGKLIRSLCEAFYVSTEKTTAAAIVWTRFLHSEAASKRWLQLLAEKEGSAEDDIRRDFGILAALMQRQHWKLQDNALRELAEGKQPSNQIRQLADWYYTEHRERERKIAGRAEVLTTRNERKMAWLDLRAEDGRVMVARDVIHQYGVELVATITAKGVIVGGASIDQGVDLVPLHGQHEIDGVGITVAGHKSPVRISPVDGVVDERFLAAARAFVTMRL